jgi:hypothetical protein
MENETGNGSEEHRTGKEKRLANLAPPWPKGVSGNPKGASGGKIIPRTFTEICREYLAAPITEGDSRTRLEALVMAIYSQGMKGNHRAASVILDRIDPAPRNNITINNNLRAPIMEALDRLGVKSTE